jgi:hypothetical protein
MHATAQLALLSLEYERIGQHAGERWRHPYEMSDDEYLSVLRRVPGGSGLRGYVAMLASEAGIRPVAPK